MSSEPLLKDSPREDKKREKNIFEEGPAPSVGAKEVMLKLVTDAANNRAKLRKTVQKCCADPDSTEYKTVQERLHKVVKEFVDNQDNDVNDLTDCLAQLIYLAPVAAGILFDLLLEDLEKNNPLQDLHSKPHLEIKGIWGIVMNDPMIAVYTNTDLKGKKEIAENHELTNANRDPNVYEVTRKRCVVSNIMDLDIIQALAYTNEVQIFAKESVQALLFCAWRPMMVPMVRIQTCLALLDLAAVLAWGLTTAKGTVFDRFWWSKTHDSRDGKWLVAHDYPADAWKIGTGMQHVYAYNSPRHVPSCWNVLAASALRQVIALIFRTITFWERWRTAKKRQKAGEEKPGEEGSLRVFWGWHPFFLMITNGQPLLLIFKSGFLILTIGKSEQVMTSAEQSMLCATFFFTVAALLTPYRVVMSKISLSLMSIKKAVLDDDAFYFVIFISVIFIFFILAWEIIDRENTFLFALVQGFRGLIVGDGDGLDFLGLKTDDDTVRDEEAHKFKAAFGIIGMMLFFTYLMQLLIAIFSNTYDKASKYVWLHFHQARAQDLRDAILGLHKFRLDTKFMNFMKYLKVHHAFCSPWIFRNGFLIFMVGLLMQVVVHLVPQQMFHETLYFLGSLVSVFALTWGAILMESSPFMGEEIDDDWFPATTDKLKERHDLYVFTRADYDEGLFLGEDQLEAQVESIRENLDKLGDKFKAIETMIHKRVLDKKSC